MGEPFLDPSILERLASQARAHGDTELVRDLVREAVASIEECCGALERALQPPDHAALRAQSHRIKSVLRQVGALRMAEAAARCESLAATGDPACEAAAREALALRDASLEALRAQHRTLGG